MCVCECAYGCSCVSLLQAGCSAEQKQRGWEGVSRHIHLPPGVLTVHRTDGKLFIFIRFKTKPKIFDLTEDLQCILDTFAQSYSTRKTLQLHQLALFPQPKYTLTTSLSQIWITLSTLAAFFLPEQMHATYRTLHVSCLCILSFSCATWTHLDRTVRVRG